MTLHLLTLPHTQLNSTYSICAYTTKHIKFCRMFPDDVIVYGGDQADVPCKEYVTVFSEDERQMWFGEYDPNQHFGPDLWNPSMPWWQLTNQRAARELSKRAEPHDLLLIAGGGGHCQSQVAQVAAALDVEAVEAFVGYEGFFARAVAFESYAWMHHCYGLNQWRNGRAFDAVIPNYFDTDEFPHLNDGTNEDLLFIGRLVQRKGLLEASEIAKAAGRKLIVAGPGALSWENGKLITEEEVIEGDHIEYIGTVSIDDRAELLASVYAVLAPTRYIEPFGGVAVEAMLAGTPVVATDWGAFTETVQPGVSGYRFRTLAQGVSAVEDCGKLDPLTVHSYAARNYSLEAVRPMFRRWFGQVETLWGEGWHELDVETFPLAAAIA